MKRILIALFVVATALILTLQTFAASGVFVSSPSGKAAPELIEGVNEDSECVAVVEICAYSDRDALSDADKSKLEAAYKSIVNTDDLADLNEKLGELANTLQISSDKLAVSDLFNVGYSDCASHNDHGKFSVKIKPVVIDNFACLMYYDGSAWVVVENVVVDEDEATITFDMSDPAPYAIVVHDGSAVIPNVDDDGISAGIIIGIWLVVKLVDTSIVFFVVYKESKNKEENQEEDQ